MDDRGRRREEVSPGRVLSQIKDEKGIWLSGITIRKRYDPASIPSHKDDSPPERKGKTGPILLPTPHGKGSILLLR